MASKRKERGTTRPPPVRERLLVLGIVSTLQPVSADLLVESLTPDLSKEKIGEALEVLRKEGLIGRLKDDNLRVTYKGQQVFASRSLAKARDISRMLYLVRKGKGGGEKT